MAKEYFASYYSYLDVMEQLNDAECGRLYRACLQYSKLGTIPNLDGNEKYVFPAIKSQIDRDNEKYSQKCEANRENILRRYTNVDERIRSSTNSTNTKEKEKENTKDNTPPADKPQKTQFAPDSKPYQCAVYLDKQICERLESRQPSDEDRLQKWAVSFEQTNRIDKKSWELIEEVLVFSQEDTFWRQNILSGDKFRKQFEKLQAKIGR